MFASGLPGDIIVEGHLEYGAWVSDCDGGVDFFCVVSNGGIHKDPIPGDCEVAALASSWGSIKALYR